MPEVKLDERTKKEIWKRDEFTCALCGKMVPWQEVCIVHRKHHEGKECKDTDDLLTACVYCLEETSRGTPKEKDRRRLRRLLRELMEFTEYAEDVIFEEDLGEDLIKLSKKLEELKKDNRLLTDAVQEKEKIAIAYKVKMDRALKDLENYKNRSRNEVDLKVRDRTKTLFLEMIQTLDNIERAIIEARKDEGVAEVKKVIEGLLSIRKFIVRGLENNGVTLVDPIGEPFDPRQHESIGLIEDGGQYSDTIVKVELVGFKLGDMVLRPAKVFISRGGPKRPKEERPDLEVLDFDIDGDVEEFEEAEDAGDIVEVGDGVRSGEEDLVVVPKKRVK
ncbi:MAG: nucleotide exchange factor GrpE [Thermoplasmatota archaeon]